MGSVTKSRLPRVPCHILLIKIWSFIYSFPAKFCIYIGFLVILQSIFNHQSAKCPSHYVPFPTEIWNVSITSLNPKNNWKSQSKGGRLNCYDLFLTVFFVRVGIRKNLVFLKHKSLTFRILKSTRMYLIWWRYQHLKRWTWFSRIALFKSRPSPLDVFNFGKIQFIPI